MVPPPEDNLSPTEAKGVPTPATTTKVDMAEAVLDGAKVVVVVDTTAEMQVPLEIWGALAVEVLMPALILKMRPDSKLEMDKLLSPGKYELSSFIFIPQPPIHTIHHFILLVGL
jgi:hypothetical protein